MKKVMLGMLLLVAGGRAWSAEPYIGYTGGLIKESYGVRGGAEWRNLDMSLGYLKDTDHDVDFHTMGAELYLNLPNTRLPALTIKLGGGAGYTMPNLPDGISKTADNGYSLTAGAGLEYAITKNWAIVGSVHRFFFTTDTHTTVYSSHEETLSTGQAVEVLDVEHFDNSEKFDNTQALIQLRYYY